MSKLIEKVTEHLIENFKGITRWDKSVPYHTHPLEVSRIAESIMGDYINNYENWDKENKKSYLLVVQIVALWHDHAEDLEKYFNNIPLLIEELKEMDTDKELAFNDYIKIGHALHNLNKNNYDNYRDFVITARSYNISRIVKIADIKHNLSDLKKGSLKDKYLLALHILEN